jgi:autotransporter-associated beta strand protein
MMSLRDPLRRTAIFAGVVVFIAGSIGRTYAATKTWNSTASSDWQAAGNWTGGVPTSADIGSFAGVNPPSGIVFINLKNGSTQTAGAVSLSSTSGSITIGNNETGGNTNTNNFVLNGTTVNAIANTILANTTTSPTTLTIQPNVLTGNKGMDLRLGAAASISNVIQASSGNSIVISSNITQVNLGNGISFQGGGTLTLSGANTYTGNTSVTAGTLLVSNPSGSGTGTGNVTVNGSGTTLGGTGTISGTVTLGNTTPGAILNAGPSGADGTSASVGTLHTGALTLTGANTFHVDAFGTAANQWDQVVVSGLAALGTTSQLQLNIATAGLNFIANTTYILIDATTISGSFSNATEGSVVTVNGYNFTAHYDAAGGNFDLIAIPEPSTWVAAALAMLVIGFTRGRKFGSALKKLSPEV